MRWRRVQRWRTTCWKVKRWKNLQNDEFRRILYYIFVEFYFWNFIPAGIKRTLPGLGPQSGSGVHRRKRRKIARDIFSWEMAFIHEGSCECTKSELDLFSIPPTQTSMEQGSWIEYHPLTAVRDGGPIEFEISLLFCLNILLMDKPYR